VVIVVVLYISLSISLQTVKLSERASHNLQHVGRVRVIDEVCARPYCPLPNHGRQQPVKIGSAGGVHPTKYIVLYAVYTVSTQLFTANPDFAENEWFYIHAC
jgi:hypothetical protein